MDRRQFFATSTAAVASAGLPAIPECKHPRWVEVANGCPTCGKTWGQIFAELCAKPLNNPFRLQAAGIIR